MLDVPIDLSPVQMIGYCGTLGGMLWPFCRGRLGILTVQLVPCVCFSIHLGLLGATTGAALNTLAALQVLAAIPLGTRPNFRIVYLMILPFIALLMAVTWDGLPSLFAATAMALMSLGRYQTGVVPFRLFMLLALPCWLAHNTLVGSLPAMLSDIVGITVNLWMLVRAGAFGGRSRPVMVPCPGNATAMAPGTAHRPPV